MSIVEASVVVNAKPEQVWRVVADPRNLPRWDRHITRVDDVPADGLRRGTEYTTEIRFMGVRVRSEAHVLEIKRPEYSKIRLAGAIDAVIETWLQSLDGERTRLRHRVDYRFRGGPLGEFVARASGALGAASILRRGVEAQKRDVERSIR